MNSELKNTYQESLICPFIITSSSGKVLFKNIAAEKILSFVRKGVNILRYISEIPPCEQTTEYTDNGLLIINLRAYTEGAGNYRALAIPYIIDDTGAEVSCLLFKSTITMLDQENAPVMERLLSNCLPLLKNALSDIMSVADGQSLRQVNKFVRNNCVRIYHMDNILSEFYMQKCAPIFPVRGVYEVCAMLRELRDHISESSTYLGYRISYSVDDNPFLLYTEPQHFYAMLIFAYSIIYRYSTDGKINISYTSVIGQPSACIVLSTLNEVSLEHNRFDHSFTAVDLAVAGVYAQLCGCSIIKNTGGSLLELEIQFMLSEKIKGLLKSDPDMMYFCGG